MKISENQKSLKTAISINIYQFIAIDFYGLLWMLLIIDFD